MKVKDLIMYQATTRDYKVGDIIKFGNERNYFDKIRRNRN